MNEAHHIKHGGRGDEHREAGNDAPRDHDPRDPDARADLVQDDVAGDFEDEITEEKDARAEAIDGIAQAEIGGHLQLREAHVYSIQICHHITKQQQWREPPRDLLIRSRFERRRRRTRARSMQITRSTGHVVS
jgi:hypothetical protein